MESRLKKSEANVTSLQQKLWESYKTLSLTQNKLNQVQQINNSPQQLNEELQRTSKFADQQLKVNQILRWNLYEHQMLSKSSVLDFKLLHQVVSNEEFSVYKVHFSKLGREYVLKILKDVSSCKNLFYRNQFYSELQLYSSLPPHTNILTLFTHWFSNFASHQNNNNNIVGVTNGNSPFDPFQIDIKPPSTLSHVLIFERESISLREFAKSYKMEKRILMKMLCDLAAGIAHLYKSHIAHTCLNLDNINVKVENNVYTFQISNLQLAISSPDFVIPFNEPLHKAQLQRNPFFSPFFFSSIFLSLFCTKWKKNEQ